eukprot:COSAG03_NODE_1909_length_3367_cov_9.998164_1_plen_37_part_00
MWALGMPLGYVILCSIMLYYAHYANIMLIMLYAPTM